MSAADRVDDDRYEAALGLAWLGPWGNHGLLGLLRTEGTVAIWRASRARLLDWNVHPRTVAAFQNRRALFDREQADASLAASCVQFIPYDSSRYPEELCHLSSPPAGLFVRGNGEVIERLLGVPRVTIVGTRRATTYGVQATDAFAGAFATRGVAIVSGLALGVDGRAHQAALEAGGLTIAVLGCGVDVAYPKRNRWLYHRLVVGGAVLSELPPGTVPARWTFPHRNRLLAALGDAVLVVEAPKASGALQTVGWALELGRPVFSVPGSIYAENQQGCNRLLLDGAGPAVEPSVTVEDFLLQTRMQRGKRQPRDACRSAERGRGESFSSVDGREPRHEKIMKALASGPSSVDGLLDRLDLEARELTAALAELELVGRVRRTGPGIFVRAP